MLSLPPYAQFLGISTCRSDEGELIFVMPFGDVVLGRPGFLHGGAIAGLLEFAAFGTLYDALGSDQAKLKPINVSVSFMRGGTAQDTFAAARISRVGKRVAIVEVHAWQQDRDKPIASAQMNVMVRRAEPALASAQ